MADLDATDASDAVAACDCPEDVVTAPDLADLQATIDAQAKQIDALLDALDLPPDATPAAITEAVRDDQARVNAVIAGLLGEPNPEAITNDEVRERVGEFADRLHAVASSLLEAPSRDLDLAALIERLDAQVGRFLLDTTGDAGAELADVTERLNVVIGSLLGVDDAAALSDAVVAQDLDDRVDGWNRVSARLEVIASSLIEAPSTLLADADLKVALDEQVVQFFGDDDAENLEALIAVLLGLESANDVPADWGTPLAAAVVRWERDLTGTVQDLTGRFDLLARTLVGASVDGWDDAALEGALIGRVEDFLADDDGAAALSAVEDLEGRVVRTDCDLDLQVPGEYPTPIEALAALERCHIEADEEAVITVADGRYPLPGPIRVDHPDGARIRLVGNPDHPDFVVLSFVDSDGLQVGEGGSLGGFDGFELVGTGVGTAFLIESGATLEMGSSVVASGFGTGLWALGGAQVNANDGLPATGIELGDMGSGVLVRAGARVDLGGAYVHDTTGDAVLVVGAGTLFLGNALVESAGVFGVRNQGGYVSLNRAVVRDTGNACVYTYWHGMTEAVLAEVSECAGSGFRNEDAGAVYASSSRVSDVGDRGFYAGWGSYINAQASSVVGSGSSGVHADASFIQASDVVSRENDGSGFQADVGGYIYVRNASALDNALYGFSALSPDSSIYGFGVTSAGNLSGDKADAPDAYEPSHVTY